MYLILEDLTVDLGAILSVTRRNFGCYIVLVKDGVKHAIETDYKYDYIVNQIKKWNCTLNSSQGHNPLYDPDIDSNN